MKGLHSPLLALAVFFGSLFAILCPTNAFVQTVDCPCRCTYALCFVQYKCVCTGPENDRICNRNVATVTLFSNTTGYGAFDSESTDDGRFENGTTSYTTDATSGLSPFTPCSQFQDFCDDDFDNGKTRVFRSMLCKAKPNAKWSGPVVRYQCCTRTPENAETCIQPTCREAKIAVPPEF
jgi:hypothetical protein